MILDIIIFFLTTLMGYYIYCYIQIHYQFRKKGVKYLPGVPIFGNILGLTFLKRHYWDELQDVYSAFPDEKYVGFMELTFPLLLIQDPELIKNIIVKDFNHFIDHREFFSECDPLFAGSMLFMKGEKWRHMRTTLTPAFTASKMKFMLPFMLENTHNIIEYLHENQSQDVNVDDLTRRYTNDVIASAGFGLKVNSLKDRDNEFYRHGSTIFDFNLKQRLLMMLMTHFPEFGKKLGMRIFSDDLHNFFRNIISSAMEYRRKGNIERPDMIQLLMETSRDWTEDDLIGQVFFFFAAGFENSASTLVMAIHELALNPDVQEKLYQEARKFKEEKEFTYDSLNELKYLASVINESLRRWSPAIFMSRTCVKTYELPPPREGGKSYVIKPGDVVYNMVNVLHMDPKYFPEPEKFDPDRFSDENKHKIIPFSFLPFGAGPRVCIGFRLTMLELKVFLYHIILNFEIVKTEKTLDPIRLKPHSFLIRAVGDSWVKFEKRDSKRLTP